MKMKLECLPCLFRQALEAGKMATNDEIIIRKIINNCAQMIPEIDFNKTAPAVTEEIHDMIKRETGIKDLYQDFKERHIQLALDLYPLVKNIIKKADNTIEAALIMAASGNSIDAGINLKIDVGQSIKNGVKNGFYYSDYPLFKEKIKSGAQILIIADNSGEAVFDKLLIEELNKYDLKITYAVRSQPILNDLTIKEAKKIGMDQLSQLISSGCKAPGMIIEEANKEFREAFEQADLIISKGQGNYEGLSELKTPIFYLLKAKCEVIARELDVPEGSLIFKYIK